MYIVKIVTCIVKIVPYIELLKWLNEYIVKIVTYIELLKWFNEYIVKIFNYNELLNKKFNLFRILLK